MGAPILEHVAKNVPDIFMDCHMMVSNPEQVSWLDTPKENPQHESSSMRQLLTLTSGYRRSPKPAERATHSTSKQHVSNQMMQSKPESLTSSSPAKPQECIDLIHSHQMLAGVAISPETPSSSITDSIGNSADLLLVMTVRPGRGGQKFMPECLDKVSDLRQRFPGKNIQVDGGVGSGNACQCAKAGSNVLVAGTAIFGSKDPKGTIKEMREAVNQELKA